MTLQELIAIVPLRTWRCPVRLTETEFVSVDDIPQPFRSQLDGDMRANQAPVVPGFSECIYAQDWLLWVNSQWYGRAGPRGLVAG